VNREEWGFLLFCTKPLVYCWLFAIPRLWLPREERPSYWRPVVAGLLRFAGGLVLLLPLAAMLASQGAAVAIPVLAFFRFVLWTGITTLCFRDLPWSRNLLFSAVATALNVILDFTMFQGSWTDISIC
jgi:hypothetical protein